MTDSPIHTAEDIGREFEEAWRAMRMQRFKFVWHDIEYRNRRILDLRGQHRDWSAARIGKALQVSRNVVIGVLDRARKRGIKVAQPLNRRLGRDAPPHQQPEGCRYIHGHPERGNKDWHYCQAKTVSLSSPWCQKHEAAVFQQPKPDEADAA